MSSLDRIDSESRYPLDELLRMFPGGLNAIADIVERRAVARKLTEALAPESVDNVTVDNHLIQDSADGGTLRARTYTPANIDGELPGLVFIHGGGMIMGDLDSEDFTCRHFCDVLNVVVISLDYRKAPEFPYPAAPEDCYQGLLWISKMATMLKIDKNNLGIYGGSAGGGLVIAVALMSRDRGGQSLKYMMPIYPMIDDRHESASSHEVTDVGIWDRSGNIEAWQWYLGGAAADHYAAPARATDLEGLPPAFIDVGEVDLFRDESIEFAEKLKRAGVPTEMHVYPGAYHASELLAPEATLSKKILANRLAALRRFIDQG